MRIQKFTLSIIFSLCAIYSFSQENHTVRGNIENTNKEPIAMGSIQIYRTGSKELLKEVYANENGEFEIPDLKDGIYNLIITEYGYKQSTTNIEVKGSELILDHIVLEPASNETIELKGAFVRAKTSQYRNEIDKRIIEVGNDLVSAGTDAASVLNNIPSVNVDPQSGAVTLRGNENVKIFIDGKPSSLSAAQILKQIPSDQIQRIEIITNPSAKYEADGKSGIINIVLVKGAKKGYNLRLTTGYEQGQKSRYNSSLSTNVNVGKFNFFGNVNYAERPFPSTSHAINYESSIKQDGNIIYQNKNLSYKVGLDWFISDKNSLTIYTNQTNYDFKTQINSTIYQSQGQYKNLNNISEKPTNSDYSLNYKLDFNKKDHYIILDAFYSKNNGQDYRDYFNHFPKDEFYSEFRDENINNTRINLDYTNQIEGAGKIESGVQYRKESSRNDFSSNQFLTYPEEINGSFTNFRFDRSYYSAYTNYNQKFNKFGAQLGLRLENVKDELDWINSLNTAGTFNKTRTNLFPSVFFTYDLTDKATLSLNYSRRVDRPGIFQLTPIPQISTALVSIEGNPNLLPEFTNSFEIGYLNQLKKGSISTNLFYRRVKDNIIQTAVENPDNPLAYIFKSVNYSSMNSYGIEASWNYKITKVVNIFIAGDFYSTEIQDYNKKINTNNFNLRMNNTYSITKKIDLQHFTFFRSQFQFLQGKQLEMWRMDLGLRYTLMDGKMSISARMNDIFKTMRSRLNLIDPYPGNVLFRWDSQTVHLGFTYNLGGKVRSRPEVLENKSDQKDNKAGGLL